ncbi:SET domain-containing protein [Candidatus Microgenomates bacterium]|nr:SET domain-containing protein [Candidatus Microgenomates bacterium]
MITVPNNFKLKQSNIPKAGRGVFTKVEILPNTYLAVKPRGTTVGVLRHKKDIPEKYLGYCIAKENDMYHCPRDFERMELVWYLNHSLTPNAEQRSDGYYSIAQIAAGDEILIDYNQFNEPENLKPAYYYI